MSTVAVAPIILPTIGLLPILLPPLVLPSISLSALTLAPLVYIICSISHPISFDHAAQ
jgi:hypothetical protein